MIIGIICNLKLYTYNLDLIDFYDNVKDILFYFLMDDFNILIT
jgi:hypothetical protein